MIHLKSLPAGVQLCAVLEPKSTWPYTKRCDEAPVGLLMEQDLPVIEKHFDLTSNPEKAVCQIHADRMDQAVTEAQS